LSYSKHFDVIYIAIISSIIDVTNLIVLERIYDEIELKQIIMSDSLDNLMFNQIPEPDLVTCSLTEISNIDENFDEQNHEFPILGNIFGDSSI
jgi:hypothetical protein